MKYITLVLFLLVAIFAKSQLYPGGKIDVIENNIVLQNPWGGGFDMPQFSASDINYDGKKDLIVFDKKGNKWLIYLNEDNGDFKYSPQYEKLFPEVINLGIIRDFNCDNFGDIFAHTNQGIKVYKNTNINGNPSFDLENPLLSYEASWGTNNIYKFNDDIPAIEDFDGDGDIDILSFDILGVTIPYYKNLSVENGYDCDSLIYEENTTCWGYFKESSIDNSITLDVMCKGNGTLSTNGGVPKMHTGSTMAVFDEDEDGDMDLLLGDVSYDNLVYLENGGTNSLAHMVSVDEDFPTYNTVVDMPIFPAAFYLDVNNDGNKDLLVSPNSKTSSVNKDCVWYYRNTANASQRFELIKKNFLVETQIDKGSYTNTTFFDHNADGLLDMFIANGYIYDETGAENSAIYHYENTGTTTNPEFTLVNENYAFVGNFGLKNLKPTFGDIDGDGDKDMIVGEATGKLLLFINSAGAGNVASISFSSVNYFNIDIGDMSTPQLIDLNEDGLLDLVVGMNGSRGNVAYFWNFGTNTNAHFHQDSSNLELGKIHVEDPGFLFGNSTPFITEINNEKFVFVGSDLGFIHKYKINLDSLKTGSFIEINEAILETRAGKRTSITIADINNDTHLDFFVGTARGGIHFYSDTLLDESLVLAIDKVNNETFDFKIYPNPAKDLLTIEFDNEKKQTNLQILNTMGAVLKETKIRNNKVYIDIASFSKGLYFVKLNFEKKFIVKKFMKD